MQTSIHNPPQQAIANSLVALLVAFLSSGCMGQLPYAQADSPTIRTNVPTEAAVNQLTESQASQLLVDITRRLGTALEASQSLLLGRTDPQAPSLVIPPSPGSTDRGVPRPPNGDPDGGMGRRMLHWIYHQRPAQSPSADYRWCQEQLRDVIRSTSDHNRKVMPELELLAYQCQQLADWSSSLKRWPSDLQPCVMNDGRNWLTFCLAQIHVAIGRNSLTELRTWTAELAGATFSLLDLHRWLKLLNDCSLTNYDYQAQCAEFFDKPVDLQQYDRNAISRFPGGSFLSVSISNYAELERQAQGLFRKPPVAIPQLMDTAGFPAVRNLPPDVRRAYLQLRERLGPPNQAMLDRAAASPFERSFLANMLYRIGEAEALEALGLALQRLDHHLPRAEVWQLMDIFPYRAGLGTAGMEWGDRFDSRLMEAAGRMPATQPSDVLESARDFQYKVYRGSQNYAGLVLTLRRALDTGKMDCIRATDMIAALCRNAGWPGFVLIRWTRGESGHSVAGMQTYDSHGKRRIDIVDGLFPVGTHRGLWPESYHTGHPDLYSVELYGRGLDSAILMEAYILRGSNKGKLIRFAVPYLPGEFNQTATTPASAPVCKTSMPLER